MRGLFNILLFCMMILSIVIIDRSFLAAFEHSLFNFNLLLGFSLYLLIVVNRNMGLFTYVFGTIISSLLGTSLVVSSLLLGLLVLLVVDKIFESFLTNRSYYTLLLLGIAGWILYYSLFSIAIVTYSVLRQDIFLPVLGVSEVAPFLVSILFLIFFLSVLYILTTFLSKKFKSYFIISD